MAIRPKECRVCGDLYFVATGGGVCEKCGKGETCSDCGTRESDEYCSLDYCRRCCEKAGHGCDTPRHTQRDLDRAVAEAVRAERERVRSKFHETFFPQRDDKLPGVWMFCAAKDEDGNCQIMDNRLFPRKADVVKTVNAVADFILGSKP